MFFFRAEDRIRVYKVTGVQTCALPISGFVNSWQPASSTNPGIAQKSKGFPNLYVTTSCFDHDCSYFSRSEERRVGKEEGSARAAYQATRKQSEPSRKRAVSAAVSRHSR